MYAGMPDLPYCGGPEMKPWKRCGTEIWASGKRIVAGKGSYDIKDSKERTRRLELIVKAVNACIAINPDHPESVAEGIREMYKALKEVKDCSVFLCNTEKMAIDIGTFCKIADELPAKLEARE
jgi:hypothetical protein